jgi:hypothetical protein
VLLDSVKRVTQGFFDYFATLTITLTVSINGRCVCLTISINGCQMLDGDNLISQPSLTTAKTSYQNLAIANRGSGGQLSVARPPGRVTRAPQARSKITGLSDTR